MVLSSILSILGVKKTTLSNNYYNKKQIDDLVQHKEIEKVLTEQMLANEWCKENLTFDSDYGNKLVERTASRHINIHCTLKTPASDLQVDDRKIFELPYTPKVSSDILRIYYQTIGGQYTNKGGIATYFDPTGSMYIDKGSMATKKIRIKKYKLDENGDAIQKVSTLTGATMWLDGEMPYLDYDEIEVDSTEDIVAYLIKIPLEKGTNANTWKVRETTVSVDVDYLYYQALKVIGCNINSNGVIGTYTTTIDTQANEISIDQGGYKGEYTFTPTEYESYLNERYIFLKGNSLYIQGDTPLKDFWIKENLSL